MNITDENYLQELFIDEAKPALKRHSGGGGASDPAAAAVMAMLGFTGTHIRHDTNGNYMEHVFHSVFYDSNGILTCELIIVSPQVTTIGDDALGIHYNNGYHNQRVLCLPVVPPKMEWQGSWSSQGGNNSPRAIYVPDESVNAYKAAENWSEFADVIKPMSELTSGLGEIIEITFTLGGTEFTAEKGMTWAEWIGSEYDTIGEVSIDGNGYVCYMGFNQLYDYTKNETTVFNNYVIEAGHEYDR